MCSAVHVCTKQTRNWIRVRDIVQTSLQSTVQDIVELIYTSDNRDETFIVLKLSDVLNHHIYYSKVHIQT